jgi:hypothetical protein
MCGGGGEGGRGGGGGGGVGTKLPLPPQPRPRFSTPLPIPLPLPRLRPAGGDGTTAGTLTHGPTLAARVRASILADRRRPRSVPYSPMLSLTTRGESLRNGSTARETLDAIDAASHRLIPPHSKTASADATAPSPPSAEVPSGRTRAVPTDTDACKVPSARGMLRAIRAAKTSSTSPRDTSDAERRTTRRTRAGTSTSPTPPSLKTTAPRARTSSSSESTSILPLRPDTFTTPPSSALCAAQPTARGSSKSKSPRSVNPRRNCRSRKSDAPTRRRCALDLS